MAIGSQSSFLRVRPTLWFGECEQTTWNGQKNPRSAEAIRRVRHWRARDTWDPYRIDSPRAGGRNTAECSARGATAQPTSRTVRKELRENGDMDLRGEESLRMGPAG